MKLNSWLFYYGISDSKLFTSYLKSKFTNQGEKIVVLLLKSFNFKIAKRETILH